MLLRGGDDERRVQIGDSESVTSTTRGLTEVDSARHAAERAAARAGVEVAELRDVNDLKLAARLFADIWATGEDRPPRRSIAPRRLYRLLNRQRLINSDGAAPGPARLIRYSF